MTQELKAKVKERSYWDLIRGDVRNIEVKLKKGFRTVCRYSFSYEFVVGNDFSCNDLIRITVDQYRVQVKKEKHKDDMTGRYRVKLLPSNSTVIKKMK